MLLKLRTGYSNTHCGWLFNCDESIVSRLVCSWINFLFLQFGSLSIWPSREGIDQSMPESFKQSFPKTRAIIDCTEVFVEAPESLHLRSSLYSDYKHHNTYKALVAITPAGSLFFVSELFPGSVSDKEIVCRCGILNLICYQIFVRSPWGEVECSFFFGGSDAIFTNASMHQSKNSIKKNSCGTLYWTSKKLGNF